MQNEDERKEDSILTIFCKKIRVDGKELILPPLSELPDVYTIHFRRKSERTSFRFNKFELTISVETFTKYDVDHPEEHRKVSVIIAEMEFVYLTKLYDIQVGFHIHSIECAKLLHQNRGRDWRPEDVVRFIPEMIKFLKEELIVLE